MPSLGRRLETLAQVREEMITCRACPRLVQWREQVARERVARFRAQEYWGRPVPGFGDPRGHILVLGLAPGAHGANRTGRIFTGDRSGDFLYAALHRAGLANQPTSVSADDGLRLHDTYIVCPVRCAPPGNSPLPDEIRRCAPWLDRELALLPRVKVVLALGALAWRAWLDHAQRSGTPVARPRPAFAHGASAHVGERLLLGSYHVSQQNTQTGKLTPAMFDRILERANAAARARRG